MYHRIILIYLIVLILNLVNCGTLYPPHILSESSSVLDDKSAHKNTGIFEEQSQKGASGIQEANGIKKEHEVKKVSGHDSGSFNHENAHKNKEESSGQRGEEKFHQQNYDSVNKNGRKGGHKKGNHKSGFHNTYHKDESENKSSYYEDSDDEGGHFEYNSRNGAGAQNGGNRFKETYDNGKYDNKHDNKKGSYDVNGYHGNEQANKQAYDQKNYYNDRRDQRNSNIGNSQAESGKNYHGEHIHKDVPYNYYRDPINNYYRDPYYREPYYREPFYRRYEPKKTITVYEDPRIYNQRGYLDYQRPYHERPFDRRYDSGYVHLDFRNPTPIAPVNNFPYRRQFDRFYYKK